MAALIHACVVIYYGVCFNEIAMLCLTFYSEIKSKYSNA